jgi:chaperonin GroES
VLRFFADRAAKSGPFGAVSNLACLHVVAVGPGARDEDGKLHPLDVKTGDRVLFGKWSGTEVKLDGEDLMIMKESDIMGVVDHAAANQKAA